ncbi:hypothetical protein FNH22_12590 [Fulvivirga sp. M361]|uniref:hypothetical protein n=1 Tax=Fulvivirga sp. M361 TaxID=2594266 RepID=UPI001179E82E|nr:hypothetical protein [Fulvivirga sp. M361]TRX58709.1 hypothetical protein FNH22_12590 [Fulvivirga sp. M361]
MLNSNVLDIVIGLVFIYLILSLFASAINELVMRWLYSRGKNLKKGIVNLLSDNGKETDILVSKFLQSPSFRKFCSSNNTLPSYLTDRRFAEVLLFILNGDNSTKQNIGSIKKGVEALPEGNTRQWLMALITEAGENLEDLREQLKSWYNDVMQRASGWYKRKAHLFLFIIGFLISMVMDADTFQIVHKLNNDPLARAELVKMAELQLALLSEDSAQTAITDYSLDSLSNNQNRQRIGQLEQRVDSLFTNQIAQSQSILGLGWDIPQTKSVLVAGEKIQHKTSLGEKIESIWSQISFQGVFGWLITALAISLGAPFWYDLLNRVASLRSTGQKPVDKEMPKSSI